MEPIETRLIKVGTRNVVFKAYADGRFSCVYETASGAKQMHLADKDLTITFDTYINAMSVEIERTQRNWR